MTSQEQDCVRWCYLIGGLSRKRLAIDFRCSIAEIEKIVSTDLGGILNPGAKEASEMPKSRARETTEERNQLYRRLLAALAD